MWLIVVYLADDHRRRLGVFHSVSCGAELAGASLPFFLAMYFLFLWFSWLIAVKLTAPKTQTS